MPINKHRYSILKDRKLLHKVGKQWVVVSAFVLALLGAKNVATTVHADADSNSENTLTNKLNQKLQQNQKLVKANQTANANQQNSTAISQKSSASQDQTDQNIMQSAKRLHSNILANNMMKTQVSANEESQGRTMRLGSTNDLGGKKPNVDTNLSANKQLGKNLASYNNNSVYPDPNEEKYNPMANNDNDYNGTDHWRNRITYDTVHAIDGNSYRIANDNDYKNDMGHYLKGSYASNKIYVPDYDSRKASSNSFTVGNPTVDPNTGIINGKVGGIGYYYYPLGGHYFRSYRNYSEIANWNVQGKTYKGIISSDEAQTNSDSHEEPGTLVFYFMSDAPSNVSHFLSDGPIITNDTQNVGNNHTFRDLGIINGSLFKQARVIKFATAWVRNTDDFSSMLANDNNVRLINFGHWFNPAGYLGQTPVTLAGMMKNNPNLRYVNMSGAWGDTSDSAPVNYTNMQSMFKNDYSLLGVDFADKQDLKMLPIDGTGPIGGTEENVPFTTQNVTNMQNMFMNDRNLFSIVVPSSFTTTQIENQYENDKEKAMSSSDEAAVIGAQNKLNSDTANGSDSSVIAADQARLTTAENTFKSAVSKAVKAFDSDEKRLDSDKRNYKPAATIAQDKRNRDQDKAHLEAIDSNHVESGMHNMFKGASLHYVINESSDFIMPSDSYLITGHHSDGNGKQIPDSYWYDVVSPNVDLSKVLSAQPTTYYTAPFKIPLIMGAPLPKGQYATSYGNFPKTTADFQLYTPSKNANYLYDSKSDYASDQNYLTTALNKLQLTQSDANAFNDPTDPDSKKNPMIDSNGMLKTRFNGRVNPNAIPQEVVNSDLVNFSKKYAHKLISDNTIADRVGSDIANSIYCLVIYATGNPQLQVTDHSIGDLASRFSYIFNTATTDNDIYSTKYDNIYIPNQPAEIVTHNIQNNMISSNGTNYWHNVVYPNGKLSNSGFVLELMKYAILHLPNGIQYGNHYYTGGPAGDNTPYPDDKIPGDNNWGHYRGSLDIYDIIKSTAKSTAPKPARIATGANYTYNSQNHQHSINANPGFQSFDKGYYLQPDTVTQDVSKFLPLMFPTIIQKVDNQLGGNTTNNTIYQTTIGTKLHLTNSDKALFDTIQGHKGKGMITSSGQLSTNSNDWKSFGKKYGEQLIPYQGEAATQLGSDIATGMAEALTKTPGNEVQNDINDKSVFKLLQGVLINLSTANSTSDIKNVIYENIPIQLINNMFVINELNNLKNGGNIMDLQLSKKAAANNIAAIKNGTMNKVNSDSSQILLPYLNSPTFVNYLKMPFLNDPTFIGIMLSNPELIYKQLHNPHKIKGIDDNPHNHLYSDIETVNQILSFNDGNISTQALLGLSDLNDMFNDPINFKLLAYTQGIVSNYMNREIPYDFYGSMIPVKVPEGFQVDSDGQTSFNPAPRQIQNEDIEFDKNRQMPVNYGTDQPLVNQTPVSDHLHTINQGQNFTYVPNNADNAKISIEPSYHDSDVVYYVAANSDGTTKLIASYKPTPANSVPKEAFYVDGRYPTGKDVPSNYYTNSDAYNSYNAAYPYYRGTQVSDNIWHRVLGHPISAQERHQNEGKIFSDAKNSDGAFPEGTVPESSDSDVNANLNQYYKIPKSDLTIEYNNGVHIVYLKSNTNKIYLHDIYGSSDGLSNPETLQVTNNNLNKYFTLKNGQYTVNSDYSDDGLIPRGWALASGSDDSQDANNGRNFKFQIVSDGKGNISSFYNLNVVPVYDGMKFHYNKATKHVDFTGSINDSNSSDYRPNDVSNFLSTTGSGDINGDNTNSVYRKILQGKAIGFLGSSITYGYLSADNKSFANFIMDNDGIQRDSNDTNSNDCGTNNYKNAVTGTTMINKGSVTPPSFIDRMIRYMHGPYDAFVVQLSTNDATKGVPLGNITNPTSGNFDTGKVTGAIEYIAKYVHDNYHCPLIFYTCLDKKNDDTITLNNALDPDISKNTPSKTINSGQYYGIMVKRLYQIQRAWGKNCPFQILDLYNNPALNQMYNYGQKYIADNNAGINYRMHPTDAGYRLWVPYFEQTLAKALRKDITPSIIANAKSITFNPDVNGVTDMTKMFASDPNVQSITLGNNFNTSNVTNMQQMFGNDQSLQDVALSKGFDTSKVSNDNFNGMFTNDPMHSITIASSNTKLNGSNGLPKMYKTLADSRYTPDSESANDFTKGNVGTFVQPILRKPAPDTIQYVDASDGNKVVDTAKLYPKLDPTTKLYNNGSDLQVSDIKNQVPSNYHLASGEDISKIPFDSGTHDVKVDSNIVSDKVSFKDVYGDVDGLTAPASVTKSGMPSSNYTISAPAGWALVDPSTHKILNGNDADKDSKTIKYRAGNQTLDVAPVYKGLTYRYDKNNRSLEFVDGTVNTSDTNDFLDDGFGSNASGNSLLTSIKFDSDVNVSPVTKMSNMFKNDTALQTLILPNNFNTDNVTDMSSMFSGDNNLSQLTLPSNFDISHVTDMSNMFAYDIKLSALDLPKSFNPRSVKNMSNMFVGDNDLSQLTLPSDFDTSNVTNMSEMFAYDYKLNPLTLPKSFNTGNVTDMYAMFFDDDALNELTLPSDFDTHNVTNMSEMFGEDHSLHNLTLPSAFSTSSVSNMSYMFGSDTESQRITSYNKALNTLTINSNNTKFSSDAKLSAMYQRLPIKDRSGNYYTSSDSNDFSKGNMSTFVQPENAEPKDTIIYEYNGKQVGKQVVKGPDTGIIKATDVKVPDGFKLSPDITFPHFDNQQYVWNVIPDINTAHVIYETSNHTQEGETWLAGNSSTAIGAGDTSMTFKDGEVNDQANGLVNGYHVQSPQVVPYDNHEHVVTVAENTEKVPVEFINQNGAQVGSDVIAGPGIIGQSISLPKTAPQGYLINKGQPTSYTIRASDVINNDAIGVTKPVTLYVTGSSANLYIKYVDADNNQQVGSDTIKINSNQRPAAVGDVVTLPTPGDVYSHGLSQDYKLIPNSTLTYQLTKAGQNTVIMYAEEQPDSDTGKDDRMTINIYKEDPYGNLLPDQPEATYRIINGIDGKQYSVNASDYQPEGFDQDMSNGRDQPITGTIQYNGITNKTANFYYKMPPSAESNLKLIYVEYEDDITHHVVAEDSITPSLANQDYADKFIDVTKRTSLPSGYDLDSNQYTYAGFDQTKPTYIDVKVHPDASKESGIAKPITVTYYDDRTGQPVSTAAQISGALDQSYTVSDLVNKDAVPNGYTCDKNQDQQYTIGTTPLAADILVHGNQATNVNNNDVVTIYLHKEDPSGKSIGTETVHDVIYGNVGDTYSISASDYQPFDFNLDTSDNRDRVVTGQINSDGSITKSSADFYYKAQTQNAAPIAVTYNDNGQTVSQHTFSGYVGQTVNISSKVPQGYVVMGNQNTDLQITTTPQSVSLNVTGETSGSTDFIVNRKFTNGKHSDSVKASDSARVGQSTQFNPSNFIPTGYQVANTTSDQPVTVKSNVNGLSRPSVTWTYSPKSSMSDSVVKPIQVNFIDDRTGKALNSTPIRVDGSMDQSFGVNPLAEKTSLFDSNLTNAKRNGKVYLKNGDKEYVVDTDQTQTYTVGTNDNNVANIMVHPRAQFGTFKIDYRDQTTGQLISTLTAYGMAGQQLDSGYYEHNLPGEGNYTFAGISNASNGISSQSQLGAQSSNADNNGPYYFNDSNQNVTISMSKVPSKFGTITVHFKDVNTGKELTDNVETLTGMIGRIFDPQEYEYNTPTGYTFDYIESGGTIGEYNSKPQNLYIAVRHEQ